MRRGIGIAVVSAVSVLGVAVSLLVLASDRTSTTAEPAGTIRGVLQLMLVSPSGVTMDPVTEAGSIVAVQRGDPFSEGYGNVFRTATDTGGMFSLVVPPGRTKSMARALNPMGSAASSGPRARLEAPSTSGRVASPRSWSFAP